MAPYAGAQTSHTKRRWLAECADGEDTLHKDHAITVERLIIQDWLRRCSAIHSFSSWG